MLSIIAKIQRPCGSGVLSIIAKMQRPSQSGVLSIFAKMQRPCGRKRDAERYRKNAKAIAEKYHMQKNLNHDAAERMQKEDPGSCKTLSRSAIKKAISKEFKFGKKHCDVQNYKGKWTKVLGPRNFRVYIAINDTKRIRTESTVPFYGKGRWLVQVLPNLFFCFCMSIL